MRAIYRIARLELSNLFYSPVAWLLLVLFVFMTGMTFGEMMESLSRRQELVEVCMLFPKIFSIIPGDFGEA